MDITDFKTQMIIVLVAVAALWMVFKVLKLLWKGAVLLLIFLALSFTLPAMREWLFGLF